MLQSGDLAPDFTAPTQSGEPFTLSSLRGRRVALYFYPKDDTPGCTKQACSLRDGEAALSADGIAVVGVSGDDVASHARFAAKYDLPFPLVADAGNAIATAYGAYGDKTLYGRLFRGIKRTTFLIDAEGRIVDVLKRPNTGAHAAEVRRRFDAASA